jgi:heme-degrading monooxygenase HmoA
LIVRVARYRVKPGFEKDWEQLMTEHGIPMLKSQRGIMVVYIGRALEPERTHQYVTVTVWRSLEDVKAFAGTEWDRVVVMPEEATMLESDPTLEQSESLES